MPFADYDNFDACVRANQDVDDPEAYCAAIKRKVEGEQSLSDGEKKALEESECGDGHVSVNGKCVPVEEVEDVPPGALDMSSRVLATRTLSGPIKREELDDGSVVYRNMALLAEGVWTDAGSGQPTLYDPNELEVVNDNAVNIAHDSGNEVSEVGYIEADSWTVEGDKGYADIVLDMESPASEYADENLQTALESGGTKGFGGPSIEIPANAYDLKEDTATGYPKLVNGEIHGAGLVMDPASKTTSFANQVSQQGVAMSSDSQNPKVFTLEDNSMSEKLLEKLREEYNLGDDVDTETIKQLNEVGALSLEDDEEEEEEEEDAEMEDDEDPDNDEDDETDVEEETEEKDMEDEVMEAIQEQIDDLWGEIENLKSGMMDEEEMSEELSEAKQDLADAETVAELQEANEELEKRLSDLEDEPKKPKSLSEGDSDDDGWYNADSSVSHHSATGSTSY